MAGPLTSATGRRPVVTVIVLDDDFSGALAYALDYALFRPSAVRVVCVPPCSGAGRRSPIPVRPLEGSPTAALTRLSAVSDRMIAQGSAGRPHALLAELRLVTRSPLVEVDRDGVVVRFSDPHGQSMAYSSRAIG
jgi:hypothetical protein